ncbi:MAG: DUF1622 domain-containing protein [Gemmatimonadota bacterium]
MERGWVEPVARWIEMAGVAAILIGGIIATCVFLAAIVRREAFPRVYHQYRANLGRAILLGLELLVAGDIIGTILVEPTLRTVSALGLVVLIRTFLSFSLEAEIEGRLPWQQNAAPSGASSTIGSPPSAAGGRRG